MDLQEMIGGECHPSFANVADAFAENFELRKEVGASVCAFHKGEKVVDLWGGHTDETKETSWNEDTMSVVFSCTKAATALCAHLLVERGQLNLNAKVGDYWPEYACNGKEDTTVLMMLNHSAGAAAFKDPIKPGGFADWDYIIGELERMEPWWKPGIRNGYHMISFGWTVGELVRRVSGKSLGTFFREEFAEPLGTDFWIGLPETLESRLAPMIAFIPGPNDPLTPFTQAVVTDPESLQHKAMMNMGAPDFNARETHAAELGGGGGISNARGMAKLFSCLSPSSDMQMFSSDRIAAMGQVSAATREDATLLIPSRFGQGFMASMDNRALPGGHEASVIMGRNAFGHVGMGGSVVFFDPDCDLVFAYSMNRMGAGILLNARGQSLIDAAYESLGYQSNASGAWMP
ncbi:serine hydrolase domain-containing protein [Ponticaulis profundi]|uniref:Serine hydrolase domain-containing protein n=1 Tax=Ponticaulis profundi TaxID=2665222 RepID=A0ABW1S797_9PROT